MTRSASEPRAGEAPPAAVARSGLAWGELGPRVISALVLMAIALAVTNFGGRVFVLFWLLAALAIQWEWQALIGGARRLARTLVGGTGLILAAGLLIAKAPEWAGALVLASAGAAALAAPPGLRRLAAGGPLYAGCLILSVAILRRSFPFGLEAIYWLYAVVWGTDCLAFFGGRLIGGPKLWPRLSPSKTWAGFLVGILCGSLFGLLAVPEPRSVGAMLVLGLLTGAAAQLGDLFESALKRRFGAKDSSRLIPGHGGVMDRLDGFIASSTCVACLGLFRYGADSASLGLFNW